MVVTSPYSSYVRSGSPYKERLEQKKGYQSSYMKRMNERPSLSIQKSSSFISNKIASTREVDSGIKTGSLNRNKIPRSPSYHSLQSVTSPRALNSPSYSVTSTDSQNDISSRNGLISHRSFSKLTDSESPTKTTVLADGNTDSDLGYFKKYLYEKHSSQNMERRERPEIFSQEIDKTDDLSGKHLSPNLKQLSRPNVNTFDATPMMKNNNTRQFLRHHIHYHDENRNESSYKENDLFWTQVSVKVSYALLRHGAPRKFAEMAQIKIVQFGSKQNDTSQESLNNVASATSGAILDAGGTAEIAAVAAVHCMNGTKDVLTSKEEMKQNISNMCSQAQDFLSLKVEEGKQVVKRLSAELPKKLSDFKIYMVQTAKRFEKNLKKQRSMMNNRSKHDFRGSVSIGISKSSSYSSDCSSITSMDSSFGGRRQRIHSYKQQGSRRSFHRSSNDMSYSGSERY